MQALNTEKGEEREIMRYTERDTETDEEFKRETDTESVRLGARQRETV
jgi:hypothetical protein